MFGNGADQVPIGATITFATLNLEVYDDGIAAEMYEVAVDWTEDETFNSFGGEPDVQAEELGPLVSAPGGTVPTGALVLDVTTSLNTWATNPTANRGWIFRPTGTTPVRARSSEYGTISLRPQLSVTYQVATNDPMLMVTLAGSGSGTVIDGGTLTCPSSCSATYPLGSSVTLQATADPGSIFTGWSGGGCTGTGSCLVTMDQAQQVTATFEGPQTLTVTLGGSGSGTVTDGGALTCPTTCTADYNYNTSVTVTATADPGSVFTGWSGAGCTGTGSCLVTMDQAQPVTATFEGPQTLTVILGGSGSGTVTDSGALTCPTTCTGDYNYNSAVTVTATADAGSIFTGWSGAWCAGTGSCIVTMDQAQQVTATFEIDTPPPASVTVTFRNGENEYTVLSAVPLPISVKRIVYVAGMVPARSFSACVTCVACFVRTGIYHNNIQAKNVMRKR